jgi:preprotein translocase SecE subunit
VSKSRQRAKQRQQQRRAARLGSTEADEQRGSVDGDDDSTSAVVDDDLERAADLAVGAPPEELGRSDETLEHEPSPPDFSSEGDERLEREERKQPRHADEHHHERGKVLQFLVNVWAELQRVQWPNRQQLLSLTGVVLGFVLIAGGYLGLLDAIFSRIIDRII